MGDGTNFKIIQNLAYLIENPFSFSIEFFDGNLYWSEKSNNSIFTLRDGDQQGSVRKIITLDQNPNVIRVVDINRQPATTSEYERNC